MHICSIAMDNVLIDCTHNWMTCLPKFMCDSCEIGTLIKDMCMKMAYLDVAGVNFLLCILSGWWVRGRWCKLIVSQCAIHESICAVLMTSSAYQVNRSHR